MKKFFLFLLIIGLPLLDGHAVVITGIDVLIKEKQELLRGKKIGLITNHTAIDADYESSIETLKRLSKPLNCQLVALFAPEHGIRGADYAYAKIKDMKDDDGIPIYSLHGDTRRPTEVMLKNIDLLIFDIQDIGSRSYTYVSTLFYCMEEAAKYKIPLIVADRPNPINGVTIDGPLLNEKFRSFVGYINVPYVHGMTAGELAYFFNKEYSIGCQLTVIPMKGWKRSMTFSDTGLPWIPTSPQIPSPDTPLYYPTTGPLGEIPLFSIGIGYSLPFRVVGAPWMDAEVLAKKLNEQNTPGVRFYPIYFKPFFGRFQGQNCQGALIIVTDHKVYKPVSTGYLILGIVKTLYPKEFAQGLIDFEKKPKSYQKIFHKLNGTDTVWNLIKSEKYFAWKLIEVDKKERGVFSIKRKEYLIASYAD